MSHLFQRPLCDMGRAYDLAFRPTLGAPEETDGGGCDDRPHSVGLYAANEDRTQARARPHDFSLCPEHETQLRRYDAKLVAQGLAPRFDRPADAAHGR